jgi:hypothetical protein
MSRRPVYSDTCPSCGSETLVGGFEDQDGQPVRSGALGARWVVRCGQCNHEIGADDEVKS